MLLAYPSQWRKSITIGVATLIGSIIFSLPFHLSVHATTNIGWGYVYPEEFNSFFELFRIHGHFLLLSLLSFGFLTFYSEKSLFDRITFGQITKMILCILVPLLIGLLAGYLKHSFILPIGPIVFATLLTIPASGFLFLSRFEKAHFKTSGLLLFLAAMLLSIAECFYFMDRMNTLFKVYNVIWGILASGSLLAVLEVVKISSNKTIKILLTITIVPAIAASFFLIGIMCTFNRIDSKRPSLDGTSYLKTYNPTEKVAFDWINAQVKGTPTLVEAFGPSYQEFTRFAMNTGLPVVLGWEYHVQQRGTHDSEARKQDIRTIYQNEDLHQTMRALNKYKVAIIVVGRQERELYGSFVENKFSDNPAYFKRIFQTGTGNNSISLYTHRYAKSLYIGG